MNLTDKLSGIIKSKRGREPLYQAQLAEADTLKALLVREEWPAFQRILDKIRGRAVQEIGVRGQSDEKLREANYHLSLLNEMENEVRLTLQIGDQARREIEKLTKEKSNG